MATLGNLGAQVVMAFTIGIWLMAQDPRLRGTKRRPADDHAVNQPVQQVQHMGLGEHARCRAISTAASTVCSTWCKTSARMSTIHWPAGDACIAVRLMVAARCPATVSLQTVKGGGGTSDPVTV